MIWIVILGVFTFSILAYYAPKEPKNVIPEPEQENFIPSYYRKNGEHIAMVHIYLAGWLMRKNRVQTKAKLDFARRYILTQIKDSKTLDDQEYYDALRYQINIRSITNWVNKHLNTAEEKIKLCVFLIDLVFEDGELIDREYIAIVRFAELIGIPEKFVDGKILEHRKRIYESEEKQVNNYRTYSRLTRRIRALSVLGLTEKASDAEIKESYRTLVKQLHPDRMVEKSESEKESATQKFYDVQEAYEELTSFPR